MSAREEAEAALDELGVIADELQQGQMIEEDDALGRRLLGLQVRITNALEGMTH